jgi:hypothetical protein
MGFITKRLNEIFDTLESQGYVIFRKGNLLGVKNQRGELILPAKYSHIDNEISANGIVVAKLANGEKVKIDLYSYDEGNNDVDENMNETKSDKYVASKYAVYSPNKKLAIAIAYVDDDNPVRILQGMPREETIQKIIKDCPNFANEYNLDGTKVPKLFSLQTSKDFVSKQNHLNNVHFIDEGNNDVDESISGGEAQEKLKDLEFTITKWNKERPSPQTVDQYLEYANKELDGYGVEAVTDENAYVDSYYHNIIALYVNMGDTYVNTVVYSTETKEFMITSWGDFYENWQNDNAANSEESTNENTQGDFGTSPKHKTNFIKKNAGKNLTEDDINNAQWFEVEYYAKIGEHGNYGQYKTFDAAYRDAMNFYNDQKKKRQLGGGIWYIGITSDSDKFAIIYVCEDYLKQRLSANDFKDQNAYKTFMMAAKKYLETGQPQIGMYKGNTTNMKRTETKIIKNKNRLTEGTGNFYNKNASHIFAIGLGANDNDGEGDGEGNVGYDETWYEDAVDNIKHELKQIPNFQEGDFDFSDNRSYPGRSLGRVSDSFEYTDYDGNSNEVTVSVTCIIRSGYYDGANLDWELSIEDGYNTYDSASDIEDANVSKQAQTVADALIAKVEEVYSKYSDKLGVTARFSNGETMYHKVQENKSIGNKMNKINESSISETDMARINEYRKTSDIVVKAFLNKQPKTVANKRSTGTELSYRHNVIAKWENGELWITNAGWFSATTKEFLNNLPNVSISQKNGEWFLNGKKWDGKWCKVSEASTSENIEDVSMNESLIKGVKKSVSTNLLSRLNESYAGVLQKNVGVTFEEASYRQFNLNTNFNQLQELVEEYVNAGGKLIGLGTMMKEANYDVSFSPDPVPVFQVKLNNKTLAITSKQHATDPDYTIGDVVMGFI